MEIPKEIPHEPGCYIFLDKNKNKIYIGKAKDLNKRVRSYFSGSTDKKNHAMLSLAEHIDYIVTDSEAESLILENNLIKRYQPRYNIDLKDAKRYAFIKVTEEMFPRLVISRKAGKDGRFYGPFVSANDRDNILNMLRRAFKIRTCKKLPKRACLRYHIKLCDAPCISKISEEEYKDRIDACESILKGKVSKAIKEYGAKMKKASDSMQFEKAQKYKELISSINYLCESQNMQRQKGHDEDIINYTGYNNKVYLLLFNIKKGSLENKREFVFDNTYDFLEEFLVQYYSDEKPPKEIIVPEEVGKAVKDFLKKRGANITVPRRGEKRSLLLLVKKNIEITFFGDISKLVDLKDKLKLNELPKVIECFDISHLSGTSTTAAMVQFKNGKADKSNYRRFRIRSVEGIDDFKAVGEVVRRRYSRLKEEKKYFPDLIVIDGGKGQLGSALKELDLLGINIPAISIAKREEEIFVPGHPFPIRLNKRSKALLLLREIRDEAHRFAIKYNRLLRKKQVRR